MEIKAYKIVQCRFCSQWQIMGGLKFKCKYCAKSTNLKLKSKSGLNLNLLASFDTGLEAEKFLREYQAKFFENKFIGFKTYGIMSENNNLRNDERYLVGICAECHSDVYSDEGWNAELGKPMHDKCNKAIEEAIQHEFDSIVKTDPIQEHNDETRRMMDDEF